MWSTYYDIILDENGNRTNANVIEPPVILPNGPEAGLVRILTAPVGAEVSGLFVDDDGRIFVNAMHPSGQNAIVATLPQAAVLNHGIGMSSLQLPSDSSDSIKHQLLFPSLAELPNEFKTPPLIMVGSNLALPNILDSNDVVVVFP